MGDHELAISKDNFKHCVFGLNHIFHRKQDDKISLKINLRPETMKLMLNTDHWNINISSNVNNRKFARFAKLAIGK